MAQAPARCECCGALKCDGESDHHVQSGGGEILRWLADMADEDILSVQIILIKIRHPQITHRELATKTGKGLSTIQCRLKTLATDHPDLCTFLGLNSPKARAQRKRYEEGPSSEHPGVSYNTRLDKWEARTPEGEYLGLYPSESAAIESISS